MNVIIAYLETMFSTYPQTPRLLEAKAELQGMMEDAYASLIADGASENEAVGRVIRDFGNLAEVAPVLGIASDIAPPPAAPESAARPAPAPATAAAAPKHPPVTLPEAQGYADAHRRIRFRVAAAVVLFVLSPATLIALPAAANAGLLPLTSGAGGFIGLLVLFVLVAIGVLTLVATSRETAPYSRIAEGRFSPDPEVTRWARGLAAEHERGRIRALQVAITLWILSPIPLIAFAMLLDDSPQNSFWVVFGVVLVLVLVALGLGVLLPKAWAYTVAETLTAGSAGAEIAPDGERSLVGVIAAFYWPLLTAIYLGWSFIGSAWHLSWVVWPIGAVLFGALAAGSGAIESYRRARR
ncbi:permease prefix domain 1-containing protein [Leucobacter sp. M11]|uniref:permease prefix domain 1-containing protein n=1 Tax=Leucobacter sp. M11 TaxID=2993565 RepID=UPI002D7E4973|nr:permease prefix domain 1-containing protein [Leucobacter sp. M11]MEB4615175.1 permease prefix domain 1-containing protein [Leucobacter sp. M11]